MFTTIRIFLQLHNWEMAQLEIQMKHIVEKNVHTFWEYLKLLFDYGTYKSHFRSAVYKYETGWVIPLLKFSPQASPGNLRDLRVNGA